MRPIDERIHLVFQATVPGACSWEVWQQLDSLSAWTALDSLAVLEFLAGLEKEFALRFPAEDLDLALFTSRPRLLRYLGEMTEGRKC